MLSLKWTLIISHWLRTRSCTTSRYRFSSGELFKFFFMLYQHRILFLMLLCLLRFPSCFCPCITVLVINNVNQLGLLCLFSLVCSYSLLFFITPRMHVRRVKHYLSVCELVSQLKNFESKYRQGEMISKTDRHCKKVTYVYM